MRNGNPFTLKMLITVLLVLTVPMRNGNGDENLRKYRGNKVLTVPMRNGNLSYYRLKLYNIQRSYRTYEEWKPKFLTPSL